MVLYIEYLISSNTMVATNFSMSIILFRLICCERKILFQLKKTVKTDYKRNEQGRSLIEYSVCRIKLKSEDFD